MAFSAPVVFRQTSHMLWTMMGYLRGRVFGHAQQDTHMHSASKDFHLHRVQTGEHSPLSV
jgi:hypothetical protein